MCPVNTAEMEDRERTNLGYLSAVLNTAALGNACETHQAKFERFCAVDVKRFRAKTLVNLLATL